MSSHTTYFCDHCNDEHSTEGYDGGESSVTYSEYPVGDGWAEFTYPYTNSSGYQGTAEIVICSHCLASPDFEPKWNWKIADWDTGSKTNFEKGRAHAEAYAHALETLGTPDRWGSMRGVRQVFGDLPYGRVGPKLEDGTWDFVPTEWEVRRAEYDQTRVDALFAGAAA